MRSAESSHKTAVQVRDLWGEKIKNSLLLVDITKAVHIIMEWVCLIIVSITVRY